MSKVQTKQTWNYLKWNIKLHEVYFILSRHGPDKKKHLTTRTIKEWTVSLRVFENFSSHEWSCQLETARPLEIRVKEHQSRSSSAIHEHCRLEGHLVDPNKTKVLSTEVNTFKRRIKEAIQIKLTKPALNRDNGYELAAIYDTILTPKRR